MKAAQLKEPGNLSIDEIATPTPGAGEVLVQVTACGLCGTDMHTLEGRNALVRYPAIPGHEFVGVVAAVGEGVPILNVGDRVAVDPSRSCGRCSFCRSGWPNVCPDKGGYGSRFPGGFAEHVVVRQESCVVFDDAMPWNRAVLAEPLACVLHGMDRLGAVIGKNAIVFGAGTIGMLAAALLIEGGASVQMVELAPARRAIAAEWGIECAQSAAEFGNDEGWDVVVDATGVPSAIQEAVTRVRRAGTMLLLGVAPADKTIELSPYRINWHEITIIGSMAVRHSFQRAVELLPRIGLPLETLVTHTLPLGQIVEGISLVRSKDAMKVVVSPGLTLATQTPSTTTTE